MTTHKDDTELPKTIDIHYIKTGSYRTYHVDGVFGGVTGFGKLYIELFTERSPTPQIIQHEVTADGKLGKDIKRTGKKGVIREIEAGLILDIETAKILREWLIEHITNFEKQDQITQRRGEVKNE